MQKQARITSKGQITVPREVRRILGVRAGDRLLFESDGKDSASGRPLQEHVLEVPRYRKSGDRVWPKKHSSMAARAAGTMTTAIDTNVLVVALWDRDPTFSWPHRTTLEAAFNRGSLVVSAPVFAELIAAPGRTETFVSSFLEETGIVVDGVGRSRVRSAGRAFQHYAERRRKQRDLGTRRILADFLIGAHAQTRSYRLLTLDEGLYKAASNPGTIETI